MYIQKAEITNIKSIEKFEIEFKNPAGWHVLIGDNGSGKTTILRAIAAALIGEGQVQRIGESWEKWLKKDAGVGDISIRLNFDEHLDTYRNVHGSDSLAIVRPPDKVTEKVLLKRHNDGVLAEFHFLVNNVIVYARQDFNLGFNFAKGCFSASFGPFRRFEGGSLESQKIYKDSAYSQLASHLSIFNESVALTEPIEWLIGLFNTSNDPTLSDEEREVNFNHLEQIKKLINSEDFLPNNSKLESINSKGVFFKDGNASTIAVNEMSDGYRSILSLTFELIRQLVRVYTSKEVFRNIENGEMFIDLPGVVLIDEIDAHLHPTWQTRIGQWFLKYFPNLQFIVTTHSPFVCRACEKGSIWKLSPSGNREGAKEITGIDRDRLIFGNILEAIGTGVFGEVSISQESSVLLNRLAELNIKSMMGLIEDNEIEELQTLRAKFPIESNITK